MEFIAIVGLILCLLIFSVKFKNVSQIYLIVTLICRDVTLFWRTLQVYNWLRKNGSNKYDSVPKLFVKTVEKYGNKVMLQFEKEIWTYNDINKFSNQMAHYFKSKGFKKGDTIALLLENRPEYFGIWLGLSKIGVITAFINTNLVAEVLIHAIQTPESKALIYGSNYSKVVSDISTSINLELFEYGSDIKQLPQSVDLKSAISNQPITTPEDINLIKLTDRLLYIYTSGTTGFPKAAIVSQQKYIKMSVVVYYMAQLKSNDIFYNALPLCHTAGSMVAGSQSVIFGITNILKRKFSASNYWKDCEKYNCTVGNYIGEICRYLLAAHKPGEKINHRVKKLIGNGLRPQIWKKFTDTFRIEQICEAYGATEGNNLLINILGKEGAIGFFPFYSRLTFPYMTLIRCDTITGEPKRNDNGLCSECHAGEPGLLISEIDPARSTCKFEGYTNKELSKKKILCDVFKKGDCYFNSGDILEKDQINYVYFRDRIGDTFRWKGENVSTHEIEALISNSLKLTNAVVYGVKIPNTEGRAGMVAIVDENNEINIEELGAMFRISLPYYAIPLFLRKVDSISLTGTFKIQKVKLQLEGYDINEIKDKLYFFDTKSGNYVELTKDLYNKINNGQIRI